MMASCLPNVLAAKFERSCLDVVQWRGDTIGKRPLDVFDVGQLPESNVHGKSLHAIVTIRDLRDVITSRHPNVPVDYFIGYADSYAVQLPFPYTAVQSGPGVRDYWEAIDRLEDTNVFSHVTRLRYEDLVDDADAIQIRLAQEHGFEFSDSFSRFHERPDLHPYRYDGEVRAVDETLVRENACVRGDRVGRWKRTLRERERVLQQFTAHPDMVSYLIRHGYERDDRWLVDLQRDQLARPPS